jgi:hypothetical protein
MDINSKNTMLSMMNGKIGGDDVLLSGGSIGVEMTFWIVDGDIRVTITSGVAVGAIGIDV